MLFGAVAETGTVIEVTDTMPDIFKLMTRFIYKDSTGDIDASNLIDLYYAANIYDIVRLKEICADKVKDLNSMYMPDDFLMMMDLYEDFVVEKHYSTSVAQNAWRLFQKEEYYRDLPLHHLTYAWGQDTGPERRSKLPEVDIFNGALKWAKAECARKRFLNDEPKSQRTVLNDATNLFCFLRMSLDEFHEVIKPSGLFTSDEIADMTLYLANGSKYNGKPPLGRRAPPVVSSKTTA
ncbi:hypothetical protein RvY_16303-2 [Ramazzottius varieornatus]|uniref:BTB domain-containing protein n=1 Tax=Ramazzottius varieornatus TaxID=947166 RepID=A0A1D1W5N0_RAMVA|nr:hypothetical protein RvY_16303-2 [Ramazzottius varieornatus]